MNPLTSRSKPKLTTLGLAIPNAGTPERSLAILILFRLAIRLGRHQMLVVAPLEILGGEAIRPAWSRRRRSVFAVSSFALFRSHLQKRLGVGLGVVAGIATESSEFGALGGDCRLVVVWIWGGIGGGRATAEGSFGDWGGSDAGCLAKGCHRTVSIGPAFERCGFVCV
jgi:hypothetical protein